MGRDGGDQWWLTLEVRGFGEAEELVRLKSRQVGLHLCAHSATQSNVAYKKTCSLT